MKTIILTTCLLLFSISQFAQNFNWAQNYDIPNANEVAGFDVDMEGNGYAAGVFDAPISIPYLGNAYLLKTNSAGEQQWIKYFDDDIFFGDLVTIGDKVCIVGQTSGLLQCNGAVLFDSPESYMFVLMLDDEGFVEWANQYFDRHGQFANIEADGETIALQARGQFNSGQHIMHFNLQGDIVQQRAFDEFSAVDIAYYGGHTYLHCGAGANGFFVDDIIVESPGVNSATFVIAFDENLVAEWSHSGSSLNNHDGRVEVNEGGVFSYQSIITDDFEFTSEIWHIDFDGNLLQSVNPPTFTNAVSLYPDMCVTDCHVALFAENDFDFNSHKVMIWDHDLELIDEKIVAGQSYLYSGQISEHQNQLYISHIYSADLNFDAELQLAALIVGTRYPYIAKIAIDSGECTSTGIEEEEIAFAVYPNPSVDRIVVETELQDYSWSIFDLQGKLVASGSQANGQLIIDVPENIIASVYILALETSDVFSRKKIVVAK